MRKQAIAIAAPAFTICFMACGSAAAEHWVPDDWKCGEQPNTLAIADCVDAREKIWDQRLNQAWHAVNGMLQSDADLKTRMPSLKAAQLAWLKYRDANCAFYGTQQGTIRSIEVAYCLHDMTQARAIELQQIGPQ